MNQTGRCPKCDSDLSLDAPEGLCPACLFRQALAAPEAENGGSQVSNSPAPAFVPPAPADLARYFPHLEILELLGQGGMGAVYKARQTKLDRLVAVKILPPEVARDPAFAERFMREARSLARLNHAHIVTVYDFGEASGLFYFSMEFVDGKNVRQLLESGSLPQAQALQIVGQICEALRYAHDEGIVHRDIKPENILLDKKGRVKIADFGLAKLVGLTPAYLTLTGAHEVMGTLFYMAPEQTRRSHLVDHRADIYSLGVMLYEMLTGELPMGRFAPPSRKAPVDERLDAMVLRALAREPENRYQDVGELKRDLETVSSGALAAQSPERKTTPSSWPSVRFEIPRTSRKGKKYHGAIYRDENELIVEFEEDGNVEDLEIKVKHIPLSGVAALAVEWNWETGCQELVIKPARLSVLSGLPLSKSGRGRFQIDYWHERKSAAKLVQSVQAQLHLESRQAGDPERIKLAIVTPAVGLLVASLIAVATNTVILVFIGVRISLHTSGENDPIYLLLGFGEIASLAAGGFLFFAAIRMLQHRSYAVVVAAACLALFPWSPAWPFALPMGILALKALHGPGRAEMFLNRKRDAQEVETGPYAEPATGRPGKVLALFRSMRGYFFSTAPYRAADSSSLRNGLEEAKKGTGKD
jgi:serine/threonine protein kinase